MVYSARILAVLLAASISIVTALFLTILQTVDAGTIILSAAVSFSASYVLSYVVLEFLFFRGINKIDKMMSKLLKKELKNIVPQKSEGLDPFERLNDEITSFAFLKQKEIDELKKLEAFRKEFIADVSHELKTPIFAAQGFVHTLLDGAMNDKNVRSKFLKKAAKSLDGLDSLVQDLLTLSQIETGDIKMKFDRIDLFKLCEEVVDQFEEKAAEKKIALSLVPNKQSKIWVHADPKRIEQVITNLVSNALNYTQEGGNVTVSFDIGKKNVTTFVADTGEGIPAQHLNRIFERFYRVDKSRSREKGGTGLGLAIVKHILEGHNTKAEVQSEVGKGSTFSFKLSRSKEDSED
ncbi:MAG TPA: two-component sensor histidine kinase [Cytophagales bacterium]|jgi:two-component system, OmpR family, phosphate regulon sensor histidine kinase PhoR|nr:two-component sensor histidine kinase [Cytophagales bacterium]